VDTREELSENAREWHAFGGALRSSSTSRLEFQRNIHRVRLAIVPPSGARINDSSRAFRTQSVDLTATCDRTLVIAADQQRIAARVRRRRTTDRAIRKRLGSRCLSDFRYARATLRNTLAAIPFPPRFPQRLDSRCSSRRNCPFESPISFKSLSKPDRVLAAGSRFCSAVRRGT